MEPTRRESKLALASMTAGCLLFVILPLFALAGRSAPSVRVLVLLWISLTMFALVGGVWSLFRIGKRHARLISCVSAVIAILLGVAGAVLPSLGFFKARSSARRGACINNLRQIDAAKDQYALEYGGTNGTTFTWANLTRYIRDMTNRCFCPEAGGRDRIYYRSYDINPLGSDPTCRIRSGSPEDPGHHTLAYKSQ